MYQANEPENNPFNLLVADITHKCNMECANCYIPNRDIPDMDVEELYKFLKKLHKILKEFTTNFEKISFKRYLSPYSKIKSSYNKKSKRNIYKHQKKVKDVFT